MECRRVWGGLGVGVLSLGMVLGSGQGVTDASVEEQRRRLPPPARECEDDVEGEWLGHELLNGRWYRFTLHIAREEPGSARLEGKIVSHSWDGDEGQSEPPDCGEVVHNQFIGEMPAEGEFERGVVRFTGLSWKVTEVVCGPGPGRYYPDSFSGSLEHHGTEFQSRNDDGHNVIVPVVFRRVRCARIDRPVPTLPDLEEPPDVSSECGGCF